MSVTKWAKILGIILLVLGILGFVPGITSNGMLLGIFAVDGLHNIIHILTGLLGVIAAKKGEMMAKKFFKVFGVVYAIITVLGFLSGGAMGMMMNMADNLLHLVFAVLFLWLGFKKSGGAMPSASM